MASTKRAVLPINAESTEPAREPAVAGQRSAAWCPTAFLLIEPRVAAPVMHDCCGEYAMKSIADLLTWLWQGSQPSSNTQLAATAESQDQSSMADLVRLLQAYDQDPCGRG
jgi:hypothetical protein